MTTNQKLAKHYDHIIVGYNTASLSFAYELAKKGHNFCLLDSLHFNSQPIKNMPSLESLVSTRTNFNSVPEDFDQQTYRDVFGPIQVLEGPPLTFDKGEFKSFLGFGDEKIVALDAVLPFCATKKMQSQMSPENFWDKALPIVQDSIFLDQQLTSIECNDKQVESLTLNGNSQLRGAQFYFFDHLPFLFDQIGSEVKKIASQFGKAKWYSSVNLIVHHKESNIELESDAFYLLMGSKNQPCLGQFSQIKGEWVSRWESFVPTELTVDSETTGSALKEIKKQIKRAFPSLGEGNCSEQILVHDNIFAELHQMGVENGKLGNFSNLSLFSDLCTPHQGWMHQVMVGRLAAAPLPSLEKNTPQPGIEVAAPSTPC